MSKQIELSDEIQEWLRTKTKSTADVYRRRVRRFMSWYKSKYGEDVDIGHFLDRLDENQKLPRARARTCSREVLPLAPGPATLPT